jgi:hypothetical protein
VDLASDYMSEGWFDGRELAVAVPKIGRASQCLTRSHKPDLAYRAATTGAEILHADDAAISAYRPYPLEGTRPMQIPRIRLDGDLDGWDALHASVSQ